MVENDKKKKNKKKTKNPKETKIETIQKIWASSLFHVKTGFLRDYLAKVNCYNKILQTKKLTTNEVVALLSNFVFVKENHLF